MAGCGCGCGCGSNKKGSEETSKTTKNPKKGNKQ